MGERDGRLLHGKNASMSYFKKSYKNTRWRQYIADPWKDLLMGSGVGLGVLTPTLDCCLVAKSCPILL